MLILQQFRLLQYIHFYTVFIRLCLYIWKISHALATNDWIPQSFFLRMTSHINLWMNKKSNIFQTDAITLSFSHFDDGLATKCA